MFLLEKTSEFDKWLKKLNDRKAKAKILLRLQRIESGNLGDVSSVGDGIEEMRVHFGPGYRVYFKKQGDKLILLLIGGDKSTQDSDIKKAKALWNQYKEN
ncbi:type II toxin-antitoxin system RelE/ParE family toxin [Algoriphagus sp.]|uniref:type II toxin-antitoxin system RelE/ParE family toxin n=1 Tax=Algoriphagus sp. TaxID=1872435 RepID=UPI002719284F|nr:type II toxin-antitoxin system RelE/ParE family toxin [Algoriphagus sp.]MDO8965297.1 type II toxin-antitoxin system RelE/ParE family toxin [Algoriphagus sp.]MDP3198729.1 type II toxin-antitoxin system RelE/ParE family toxin [Algoriphagus sp.]